MRQEWKLARRQQGKKRNQRLPRKRPCGPTGAYGFGRVGAAVYYGVDHKSRLALNPGYLFDKKYFTAGRLGINPFAPSTVGAIGPSGWNYNSSEWQNTTFVGPGAPRALFVGLQYRWGADKHASEEE